MSSQKTSWQVDTAVLEYLDPDARSPATTVGSYWRMYPGEDLRYLFAIGEIVATGTFDAKLQQAQDNAGTGLKDLKVATQLDDTDDGTIIKLHARYTDLDLTNDFLYVRYTATVGTAAVDWAMVAERYFVADPRAQDLEAAAVGQSA